MPGHRSGTFTGARGGSVFYQCWLPADDPRAVIVLVHGAAEHSGRHARLAAHLVRLGYAVAALDLDGHGRSDGGRCCLRSFDDYVDDAMTLSRLTRGDFPHAPQVLLGHSMGGLVAANLLLAHQDEFAGCILSAAAIMTQRDPPAFQLWLVRVLSRLAPRLGVLQLDAAGVSRDPDVVDAYVNDELVHRGRMSARLVAELFRAMAAAQSRAAQITLPMLILHGADDAMTDPRGSQYLHEHLGSPDKELIVYPGLYHEIFNEPEHPVVFADVENWLARVL